MASHQLTIPSIQTPEPQALAQARSLLIERLHSAVRAAQCALFALNATGDLSDRDIDKSYERLAFAMDAFREEQELAQLDQEQSEVMFHQAAPAAREGMVQ